MRSITLALMLSVVFVASSLAEGPATQPTRVPTTAGSRSNIHHARVVIFGDSISHNRGGLRFKHWTDAIQERFELDVVNAGVGGSTTRHGLGRIDKDVLSQRADFVLISFGMNDHVMRGKNQPNVPLDEFEKNLTTMVEKIRAIGAIPVFITTNAIAEGNPDGRSDKLYYSRHPAEYYTDVGGAQAQLDRYIEAMRKVAAQLGVPLADVRKACDGRDMTRFTNGGVHPSAEGHAVYAKVVGDLLDAQFGQASR